MSKAHIYYVFIIILFIFSCEPSGKKPSDMTPQELVKSREIRKISDIDILETGKNIGLDWMKLINYHSNFSSENDSLNHQLLDSIYQVVKVDSSLVKINASLKLVYRSALLEVHKPNPIEAQILEACLYSLDNKIPISESVQMSFDNKNVLYIEPIIASDNLIGLWSFSIPKKSIVPLID